MTLLFEVAGQSARAGADVGRMRRQDVRHRANRDSLGRDPTARAAVADPPGAGISGLPYLRAPCQVQFRVDFAAAEQGFQMFAVGRR
ncbi:MAG: hypothetical protein MUE63_05320, partial [Xanthomonadales bacterium]|nr:hypothetical protein [Xanthomonadales bacterium]